MRNDFVKFLSTFNCVPDAPIYVYIYIVYIYVSYFVCTYYVYIEANYVCNMMGDTSPMPTAHSDPFLIFKFGKSAPKKTCKVQRADLTCDVTRKLAPFVLSKL